jgi:hypothetical protein
VVDPYDVFRWQEPQCATSLTFPAAIIARVKANVRSNSTGFGDRASRFTVRK